jgi:hypothetical protein
MVTLKTCAQPSRPWPLGTIQHECELGSFHESCCLETVSPYEFPTSSCCAACACTCTCMWHVGGLSCHITSLTMAYIDCMYTAFLNSLAVSHALSRVARQHHKVLADGNATHHDLSGTLSESVPWLLSQAYTASCPARVTLTSSHRFGERAMPSMQFWLYLQDADCTSPQACCSGGQ